MANMMLAHSAIRAIRSLTRASGAYAITGNPRFPKVVGRCSSPVSLIKAPPPSQVRPILLLSLVLLQATAGAAQDEPPSGIALSVGTERISLDVCEEPLWRVLARLEKESGIGIGAEGRIGKEPICREIQGETWRQLLETLLQGYNWVAVHREDGSLSRVFVLNHGANSPQIEAAAPMPPVEQVPEAVPPPEPRSGVAASPLNAVSFPGAPPWVPGPVDPDAEDLDEPAGSSVFLRGLVAPPDMAELESPPGEIFSESDEIPAAALAQGGGGIPLENLPPVVEAPLIPQEIGVDFE